MKKNNKKEPNWEEIDFKEVEAEESQKSPQKKNRSGAYSKRKGKN